MEISIQPVSMSELPDDQVVAATALEIHMYIDQNGGLLVKRQV
jgi:hypothetical protein